MNQPELVKIFKALKKEIKKYQGKLQPKYDSPKAYDLWSFKDLEIDGRKRKEIYFAGVMIHSKHVGFYFMPVYTDVPLKMVFGAELLATLKGKSCFNIKELDAKLLRQIKKALKTGFALYKKRGWI